MNTNQLLNNLNNNQIEVVTTTHNPMLVDAVPGSGKSTSITRKVAYMLSQGIDPASIILITFTKKAGEELKHKMKSLVPTSQLNKLTIGTIHSLCYQILKLEYEQTGHPLYHAFLNPKTHILTDGSLKTFLDMTRNDMINARKNSKNEAVKDELDLIEKMKISDFIRVVSECKNNGIDVEEYRMKLFEDDCFHGKNVLLYEFYQRFQNKLWSERKITMDCLLFLTYELFIQNPKALKKWQDQYKYVMIDECQDNNYLNWFIMEKIAYPENNICVVGDVDQSLYSFRQANVKYFMDFLNRFPNAKQIPLNINYRSREKIVEMANKLIKHNKIRFNKEAIPHNQEDINCIHYDSYSDEQEEACAIADKIEQLNSNNVNYNSIAVIYRTNAQSKSLEEELIKRGIPHIIKNGFGFYQRKEILDIMAYLYLAIDENNNDAVMRVINTPNRYLGKAFVQKLTSVNMPYYKGLDHIVTKPYEDRGISSFKNIIHTIKRMDKNENKNVGDIIQYLIGVYDDMLKKDVNGDERLENLNALKGSGKRFKKIEAFLSYISLMESKRKESKDGVILTSAHSSKGLEWDHVFVIGCNESIMPHRYAVDFGSDEDMEEERRIFYVAMTRAVKNLYLSSVMIYNKMDRVVSRFIGECEIDLSDS